MFNILIAEDEVILRKGIVTLIDWNSLECVVVADVSNGEEACNYIKQNEVDIIVTDVRMPIIDGLELAKFAQNVNPNIKVIVLTAFSNFEYAKQAIELNIYRYLLKSTFVSELPVAVSDAVKEIKKVQNINRNHSNKLDSIFLRSIIDGTINQHEKIKQWFSSQHFALENYYILLFEINLWENNNFDETYNNISESTLNFLDLSLKDYPHIVVCISKSTIMAIVSPENIVNKDKLYSLVLVSNEILCTVKNYMSFELNIGISNEQSGTDGIKTAYNQAASALGRIYVPDHIGLFQSLSSKKSKEKHLLIKSYTDSIMQSIEERNTQKLFDCICGLFKEFKKESITSQQMEIEILKLFSACILNMKNYRIRVKDSEYIYKDTVSELMKISSPVVKQNILFHSFKRIMQKNCFTYETCNSMVIQVNQYIKNNYKTTIKLSDISNLLHINSSYLSRLYKKETGVSIISYLNSFRIEKAKQLLLYNDYMVSEIGSMVGIEDPAYFTNVFTKYTGESPKNYAQKRINI